MNQNKLLTSLAAFSFAALILLVIVGFSLRSSSSVAEEVPQPLTNNVDEQVQLLEQTINAMATREVVYQQQLLEANQLIVNSSNPPATDGLAQQQVEALQQAVATMQARELQYQQQIEAANLLLQQPAAQVVVAPSAANYEEYDDDEYEDDDDEYEDHDDDHDDEEHDDD